MFIILFRAREKKKRNLSLGQESNLKPSVNRPHTLTTELREKFYSVST